MLNNIRKIRKSKKISQGSLAALIGVTQAAVSQWESGKTTPTAQNIIDLARILDCTTDDILIAEEEDKHNDNQAKP